MLTLNTWDIVLLAITGFIAITTLVKLMQSRRDYLLKKLRREFDSEQQRLKIEERRAKKQAQRNAA